MGFKKLCESGFHGAGEHQVDSSGLKSQWGWLIIDWSFKKLDGE